jgi:hypothetical protein
MYYSTYLAYGVLIPDTDEDHLDAVLRGAPVRYLQAGSYDKDMTFLVIRSNEAPLGSYKAIPTDAFTGADYEAWDEQLALAVQNLGLTRTGEPSWLLIPDVG